MVAGEMTPPSVVLSFCEAFTSAVGPALRSRDPEPSSEVGGEGLEGPTGSWTISSSSTLVSEVVAFVSVSHGGKICIHPVRFEMNSKIRTTVLLKNQ